MDGLEILILRRKAGIYQWELAALIGMGPGRLSEMERGRRLIPPEIEEKIKLVLRKETDGRGAL